ncbi:uncharacterized protein LOC126810901 [Patella vulgata]|uniref:uncharacterized protein LOC126810901 n=1 Tax=Patella vulgata TaxID=6465 RepID=UPI00217FD8B2|nr:uncharacterized protein LOC126810901 [Patella vulgata]
MSLESATTFLLKIDSLRCQVIDHESVSCNGTIYKLEEKKLDYLDEQFWIYLSIYAGLVIIAGLMSGLTMGLLSLDMMTLRILKESGTKMEKKYASRIIPLVSRHHLLLVTLLLANAGCVEAMPIFLDRISDPIIAICVSVSAVLIFGEVIPQAICTRFGLAIGATLSPLVYFLMGLFFIISWPLAKLLDCILGKDHETFYRRGQLKALVDLHGNGEETQGVDPLSVDEVLIIKGALDMKYKTAIDAMLPQKKIFMLDVNAKMDHKTMTEILEKGHSRIPVYDGNDSNIIGLLMTKTLIKLDPDDCVPVRTLVDSPVHARDVIFIKPNLPLFDLLNLFQTGKGHLAIIKGIKKDVIESSIQQTDDDTSPLLRSEVIDAALDTEDQILGIITLEDVLEELLQEEIEDEKDVVLEMQRRLNLSKSRLPRQSSRQQTSTSGESNILLDTSTNNRPSSSDTNLLVP